MKTFKTFMTVAAAAASLISCTKENVSTEPENGFTKITLSADISDGDQTKIGYGDIGKKTGKQIFKWLETDEVRFYTWTTATEKVNDHGKFEVADIQEYDSDGDKYSKALFSGYAITSALKDTKGCAIYPYQEGMTFDKLANPKFYVTVPTEQDGTGAKYNVLAAKTKAAVFDDPAVIGAFSFGTAMVKINIPSSYLSSKITSVKFEIDPKGSLAGSAFIAGNCNIQPTSSVAVMGGNSKSVIVSKAEGFITGDVYFTIRPLTNANFFPIDMKFTFTNKDGESKTLSKEITSATKINQAVIYDFGTVTKLKFDGGGSEEKKVDLTLDLNFTDNKNTVLYTKNGEQKVYLPTSAPSVAAEKEMYFDQSSATYTFGTYGKLYYFAKTGQTNAKAIGILLNEGKSYLKLPVIEGYKLAVIKGTHGKGSTNDPQKMVATSTQLTTGGEITDGVSINFTSAGLGEMGTAADVESLKEPVYLYCRNTAKPAATAMSNNTTVIGHLVLGYVKVTK